MLHSFSKSSPASAQDRAYQYVKSRILSLVFRPGQWLRAQDVASKVGISRTPVREALSRLEQEGFVRRDEGWGYVVQSISLNQARDLYKVREALEAEAIKEAVPHVDAVRLRALEVLLQRAEQAWSKKQLPQFRVNTRAFHEAISKMSNNELLSRMLSEIQDRVQLLGAMVFEKHDERMDEVVEENRQILEALRRRDAVLAEAAVRHHVRRAWESFVLYVVEDETLGAMTNLNRTRRGSGQTAIR